MQTVADAWIVRILSALLIQCALTGIFDNPEAVALSQKKMSRKPSHAVRRARPDTSNLQVNEAVMVTVELDFGPNIPSVAEALRQMERHYQPADGKGRTFAILDAYGEPTPDHKLHMSMHVSTEK